MKKVFKILGVALLSGWVTLNVKVLDGRGLISIEKLLAENGHITQLVEGSVITDGKNLVAFVVKTQQGSTIEILGDKQGIREIKETY